MIVGGPNDDRDYKLWKIEDGFVFYGGRRHQCCARSSERKKKETGRTRCTRMPIIGPGVRMCYTHSGIAARDGIAPPGVTKHMRSSMYGRQLSGIMKGSFERLMASENLLDTTPDIALIGSRAEEMLERAKGLDSIEFRKEAIALFQAVHAAASTGDSVKLGNAMRSLGDLLRKGTESDKAVDHAIELAERRSTRAERAREIRVRETEHVTLATIDRILAIVVGTLLEEADGEERVRRIEMRAAQAGMNLNRRESVGID